MPVETKPHLVVDPAKLLISHADYAGKTPAEARRAIKLLLDKYGIAVTPEVISNDRAKSQVLDEGLPDRIPGIAIASGMVMARCYYDGTNNTGEIKFHQPVVFDTVKGWGVTGINASWAANEYKVVGIALRDYNSFSADGGLIPVRLVQETVKPSIEQLYAALVVADGCTLDPLNLPQWTPGIFVSPPGIRQLNPDGVWEDLVIDINTPVYNPHPWYFDDWVFLRQINNLWVIDRPIWWRMPSCRAALDLGVESTLAGPNPVPLHSLPHNRGGCFELVDGYKIRNRARTPQDQSVVKITAVVSVTVEANPFTPNEFGVKVSLITPNFGSTNGSFDRKFWRSQHPSVTTPPMTFHMSYIGELNYMDEVWCIVHNETLAPYTVRECYIDIQFV